MNETARALSQRPYSTFVQLMNDDGLYYLASHPEFEACIGTGSTPEEALQDLAEVTELIIEHLLEQDADVPEPQPLLIAELSPYDQIQEGIVIPTPQPEEDGAPRLQPMAVPI